MHAWMHLATANRFAIPICPLSVAAEQNQPALEPSAEHSPDPILRTGPNLNHDEVGGDAEKTAIPFVRFALVVV